MIVLKWTSFLAVVLMSTTCSEQDSNSIIVENSLDVERSFETVVLTKDILKVKDLSNVGLRHSTTKALQTTQLVDLDGDNEFDELLFQPVVGPNSKEIYEIVINSEHDTKDEIHNCYSRFVPERTDDYAWENDRVAFRMFGPTAQKMVEEKVPGGTLTSGVDIWLKRVNYPIINKWYKKEVEGMGSYHEDTGEGLDNFHVGVSRGAGGTAVNVNDEYYFSKNFINWRTITTGPIRTSFQLEYADWDAGGNVIKESKTISLDYGSNLSRFETTIEGIDRVSVGLTLHDLKGKVNANPKNGWMSHWEPHGDSELGTAVLASPDNFLGYEEYTTDARDLSNAYAHLKVNNNKVVYYAGFGWKKSGQFDNNEEWEKFLNEFAHKLSNPLKIYME